MDHTREFAVSSALAEKLKSREMLVFHGRRYPLSIGGVSYGFTFGASSTDFFGEVSNIQSPSDVNGVYGAVAVV